MINLSRPTIMYHADNDNGTLWSVTVSTCDNRGKTYSYRRPGVWYPDLPNILDAAGSGTSWALAHLTSPERLEAAYIALTGEYSGCSHVEDLTAYLDAVANESGNGRDTVNAIAAMCALLF